MARKYINKVCSYFFENKVMFDGIYLSKHKESDKILDYSQIFLDFLVTKNEISRIVVLFIRLFLQ